MDDKIIKVILGVTVSIIMVATIMYPIIDDVAADAKTFSNDGYLEYVEWDANGTHTLTWDPATPNQFVVDGEVVPIDDAPNYPITVVTADNWIVRYWDLSDSTTVQFETFGIAPKITANTTTNVNPVSMTFENGNATVVCNDVTASATYTNLIVPAIDGIYTMKIIEESAYILGDTEFNIIGTTSIMGSGGIILKISGSIDNGITTSIPFPPTGYAVGEATATYSAVNGYENLYSLEQFEMYGTKDGEDGSSRIVFSYFLVPTEVTADVADPMDRGAANLLYAIPVVVFVALMMALIALRPRY